MHPVGLVVLPCKQANTLCAVPVSVHADCVPVALLIFLGDEVGMQLQSILSGEEAVTKDEELNLTAVAFFDEVITLYDEKPNYKENFDTMYNPAKNMDVQIKWKRTINKCMP